MRPSKFTLALLVMNVGLVAAVAYLLQFYLRTPAPVAPEIIPPSREQSRAFEPRITTQILTVEKTNDFRWVQLESEDYRAYIQRLRAIGCPEQTIRDILIADIDKLMAPRLRAAGPPRKEPLTYWQPEEQELLNNFDARASLRAQRDVDFEKREIIRELMGVDLVGERMKVLGQEDYYGRRLAFLPEEKRGQARLLLEKFTDEEQAIRSKVWEEGEPLTAADTAKLRQLREQQQAELTRLLSPEELRQYELWLSPSANAVRDAVYGMNASEDEFQKIYRLQKKFDDAWPDSTPPEDADARAKWEQERMQMEQQIRAQLGEQRYAEFERGQDADFRELNATATRYQLPADVPATIYEIKLAVLDQRAKVLADPALTDEQRTATLKVIADETARTVQKALGEKAYKYFLRRGMGSWISN
ncbi:MAG: hypothetical protein HZA89_04925 [Verrucomicrobia bacterium]|nr:hypothetical protein [Verrucomicrobiota bacterium]